MTSSYQSDPANAGALDSDFASQRQRKPHLAFRWRTRAFMVHEAAQRLLGRTENLRLLDLGAAEGLSLRYLDRLWSDSTFLGVEYTAELAARAGSLPDHIRLVVGDIENLPVSVTAGRYDVISALAVIEHLKNPGRVFQQAATLLKPGGILMVTCPNPVWERISVAMGLLDDEHHIQHLDTSGVMALARAAGFDQVSSEMFMFAPVGFLPYLKIPVGIALARRLDRMVDRLKLFKWAFVNQAIVAVKSG